MTKKTTPTDADNAGPLGHPDRQGKGDAQPAGAGDEGGLGFVGDQRGDTADAPPEMDVDTQPGEPMTPVEKDTAAATKDKNP